MESSEVLDYLRSIKDPEVPVVDIVELGIVRSVELQNSSIKVRITPTYSGCPAQKVIEEEIVSALKAKGFSNVEIITVLSPPWTTDWLSETTKLKLKSYGIAPPACTKEVDAELVTLGGREALVPCPFCDSKNSTLKSQFGSTACKALYYCNDCKQPFEYFKVF